MSALSVILSGAKNLSGASRAARPSRSAPLRLWLSEVGDGGTPPTPPVRGAEPILSLSKGPLYPRCSSVIARRRSRHGNLAANTNAPKATLSLPEGAPSSSSPDELEVDASQGILSLSKDSRLEVAGFNPQSHPQVQGAALPRSLRGAPSATSPIAGRSSAPAMRS